MKRRPVVILVWIQVIIGAAFVLLVFYSSLTRPILQLDYSKVTGEVTRVVPGGLVARAGIRAGDRLISINGVPMARGINPLFFTNAGDEIPVVTTRGTFTLVAVPQERSREEALRRGGSSTLAALSSYLIFPLDLWMLGLGVMILALRGDDRDARLSALTLVYWAGGHLLCDFPGMGALLSPLPVALRAAIYLVDDIFLAGFFAACLNFAIAFPSSHARRPRLVWRTLAVLAPAPILIEAVRLSLQRLTQQSPDAMKPATLDVYTVWGPSLLVIALVILGVRFARTADLNARRRLQLIFVSLLPGVAGWIIADIIDHVMEAKMAHAIGSVVNQAGTIAGSSIYAYAVVRHRMYNIRFLVRRSIQYAFARGTLIVAMSLPVVALAVFLYAHRNDSLASLLTGAPAMYLLLMIPLFGVIRYRRALLDSLDRRYFREQYDARRLLLQVVSMIRDGSDMLGLSRVALEEIDRALHPRHISLWHLNAANAFERGFMRGESPHDTPALPNSGALPTLLATDAEPLDLHGRLARPLVRRLPQAEREWLTRTDAYLLVPMLIEQRLAGIMLLGERMSEEPYSREDRDLLRTLAAQLALTFDYSRLKASPALVWNSGQRTPLPESDELWACIVCGRCYASEHAVCEVDGQVLVREEGVPRIIEDKYVITRILGRGGMGSVYQATQTRLNRPVAVKVLLGHLVGSASMRGRFEREARIVARLKHPSIVTIHDFGVLRSNHAYLVMEYLEGQTLRKVIQSGPQPLDRVREIMRPVCDAVDTAHKAGVVHRDLKPENIMVLSDRTPRVLDFGLAKMTGPLGEDEATVVQSGQSIGIVGTLMYLAPEVLSGKPADAWSDQYSLAIITYELLAGHHPFADATDLASIVRSHTESPVPPLRHIPLGVNDAILRALSKTPAGRWGSVGEFWAGVG